MAKIPLEHRLTPKQKLMELLSWSESSIDRRLREDLDFPRPVRLGPRTVRWRLAEVLAYIDSLPLAEEEWR
ncbi:AlpA family phage regulatory protein [Martelella mediterranea]|uniref:helix-turn-helix transcriptional regulator n=1 Tax=Martelella mediterranea TaxID=293089 RepID=UPI003AF3C54C|nr:AlpA family phage regulatory protein [Martelella mediterranea]